MRFYTSAHRFYCGVDLHARSMYLCILDQAGTIVVHEEVPPPKVMPDLTTTCAVALVGPATEQWPCVGTATCVPLFVKSAEPMFAIPGCGAACAGATPAARPASNSVPASPARLAMVLRIALPSLSTGRPDMIDSSSTP